MAASYYGVPRTTADIDFVVAVEDKQLDEFLDSLGKFGLEVEKKSVKRQLQSGYKVINLQERGSPLRADFMIQPAEAVERRPGTAVGLRAYYQAPEQLVLAKLRMIKATHPAERSFKDREDIRQILANTKVDRRRIARLARAESTSEILSEILGSKNPPRKSSFRGARGI